MMLVCLSYDINSNYADPGASNGGSNLLIRLFGVNLVTFEVPGVKLVNLSDGSCPEAIEGACKLRKNPLQAYLGTKTCSHFPHSQSFRLFLRVQILHRVFFSQKEVRKSGNLNFFFNFNDQKEFQQKCLPLAAFSRPCSMFPGHS